MNMRNILLVGLTAWALSVPANAAELITVSDEPLRIETNSGALLKLRRPAATVFVANPEIADVQVKSPRLIYITAKRAGETSLFAVDENDRVLLSRRLLVTHNLTRLRAALRDLVPNSAIDVRSVDGAIVLSGEVLSASASEDARRLASRMVSSPDDLINKLSITAPNQVHLRVRIAEVSRTVFKQFAINWETVGSFGSFIYGLGIGRDFINEDGLLKRSGSTNDVNFGFQNGNHNVNALIDAMDKEGLIKILAEPSLTAVSGETASFLAGGEFPIVVAGDDNKVSIEFKEFGVSLAFTPTLLGGGRISLKVKPEVSQLSAEGSVLFQGFAIPSLTTRRAETTVELGSGQSFAIAGLLQNNTTQELAKFPGLGDLPILGPLFRSEKFQRNETELVIIVTPYIVRPVSNKKLASPTDGLTPPTDIDRFYHGRLYRPRLGRRPSGPNGRGVAGLIGPVGFVLE